MGNDSSRNRRTSEELLDTEMNVLKSASQMSAQEIRNFYDQFKRECPSGKMNKQQFLTFYKQIMGVEDTNQCASDYIFGMFDQNHTGTIGFTECVFGIAIQNSKDLNSELELGFQLLDTSGDQQISYDEVLMFFQSALKLKSMEDQKDVDPNTFASTVFKIFGVDQGQKVSKKQFIEGCKNNKTLTEFFGNQ